MLMSGEFDGQQRCSWSHSLAILNVWDVTLSCWNCPSSLECTKDMSKCRWSARMCTYMSPVRIVSRHKKGSHITPTACTPHYYRTSTSLNSLLLSCRSMDSWDCLHTHTQPSAWYNWKRDSSDQATCFLSSTVQCRCWWAQARCKALCRAVSKGTRVDLWLWKFLSMMFCWMVHMLTLLYGPA